MHQVASGFRVENRPWWLLIERLESRRRVKFPCCQTAIDWLPSSFDCDPLLGRLSSAHAIGV
jgi:hypothetical protein